MTVEADDRSDALVTRSLLRVPRCGHQGGATRHLGQLRLGFWNPIATVEPRQF